MALVLNSCRINQHYKTAGLVIIKGKYTMSIGNVDNESFNFYAAFDQDIFEFVEIDANIWDSKYKLEEVEDLIEFALEETMKFLPLVVEKDFQINVEVARLFAAYNGKKIISFGFSQKKTMFNRKMLKSGYKDKFKVKEVTENNFFGI